ncbi:hypothetical protein [Mangrovibrevibacter kandeliae]|uniref:hypothetical protein n=1 Tax=Mangrovibrevibacter kandeliae TaxID=2968473 RepID=UPI002118D7DC|nr:MULTISPECIES: hypothetical protein [unclassified Aurantimonas]MCQ8781081.1 hypothetical protein [Aurantimonas sp. CSK15Z-1]MCW4113862.1 hypothetical protein [Aurantimonas sp. MSK8Z-1]
MRITITAERTARLRRAVIRKANAALDRLILRSVDEEHPALEAGLPRTSQFPHAGREVSARQPRRGRWGVIGSLRKD